MMVDARADLEALRVLFAAEVERRTNAETQVRRLEEVSRYLSNASGRYIAEIARLQRAVHDPGPLAEPLAKMVDGLLKVALSAPVGSVMPPAGWLQADGVLRLSDRLMAHLGLPLGGGIVAGFGEAGVVEVMSNETWIKSCGLDGDETNV